MEKTGGTPRFEMDLPLVISKAGEGDDAERDKTVLSRRKRWKFA